MAGPGNILIRVGADTDEANKKLGDLDRPLEQVHSRASKMGDGIRKATLPAVAALGALGVAAVGAAKAAAEDEQEQAKLAGTLQRVAGATTAQVAAAENYIAALSRQTGVTDSEMRPALARLASATGDVGLAQKDLKIALDISAQSGKSLETVSAALAKAYDGKTQALGKLVPGMDAATLKAKEMGPIMEELAQKTGGAAAQAADTAAGRYKIMQVQMGELQEKIGTAVLPVMSKLADMGLRLTTIASEHTGAVKVLAIAIGGLATLIVTARVAMAAYNAVQIAVRAATAVWTGVQWALNAALTANPIGIVVTAIAALVAGVVIAYQHSQTFRNIVNALWQVFLRYTVLGQVIKHFDQVKAAIERVIEVVKQLINWIANIHWPEPPGWLSSVGGAVGGIFGVARPAPSIPSGGFGLAPSLAGAGPLRLSGDTITINVSGAIDPEGVARQIARLLAGHDRRMGR